MMLNRIYSRHSLCAMPIFLSFLRYEKEVMRKGLRDEYVTMLSYKKSMHYYKKVTNGFVDWLRYDV